MKPKNFIIAALACIFFPLAHAQTVDNCRGELPAPQKAKCIKQDFEAQKNDKEFIKLTKELLQEGDEHYRKRRYYKAYRAYDLANAYLPSPYAYLHASESIFIAYVTAKHFEDDNGKATGSCLQPSSFVWVVDDILKKDYKVGVELAKIHTYGPPVSPAYLVEAEKRISCLEAMATQYRGAKTGCVEVAKIRACMGMKQ